MDMILVKKKKLNQKGITIISLIILVVIIGAIIIYTPKVYHYALDQNVGCIVPIGTLCTISSFDTHCLYPSFVPLVYYFII